MESQASLPGCSPPLWKFTGLATPLLPLRISNRLQKAYNIQHMHMATRHKDLSGMCQQGMAIHFFFPAFSVALVTVPPAVGTSLKLTDLMTNDNRRIEEKDGFDSSSIPHWLRL